MSRSIPEYVPSNDLSGIKPFENNLSKALESAVNPADALGVGKLKAEGRYVGSTKVEEKETYPGGATRSNCRGKGRYDLIPMCFVRRVALRYEEGAEIHGDNNWKNGQPVWRLYSSAIRHLFQALAGMKDEDHLAAAAWNVAGIMYFDEQENSA